MKLSYGVKEETYKAVYGKDSTSETNDQLRQKNIHLKAVKNSSIAFQLLLLGDEHFSVSITDNSCFDKTGILDNIRLKVFLSNNCNITPDLKIIGYIEDDDRLPKADILLDDESVHVEKGKLQPIWIELSIPEDTVPAEYQGKVNIYTHKGFESERIIGEICFSIDVKGVTLPSTKDNTFFLDLWQHNSNIARKHEVPLWSDQHFCVMKKYIKSLAELGQKALSVVVSEIPWSGQFCYRDTAYPSNLFEYSMVRVKKDNDNRMLFDFSILDRYIDMCFKFGIDAEIEVFGLVNIWMCEEDGFGKVIKDYSDGIRIRYLDMSDGCYKYIGTLGELRVYIEELQKHFLDRGLLDKVRILADEPADLELYEQRLEFLKETAPLFKYKAAVNDISFIRKFADKVDDFVMIFPVALSALSEIPDLKKSIKGRLYWYVCCWPDIPNTFIGSYLLESYAIGYLTKYMGLDGFLRWNYTVWPENPRERISFRSPSWKAGDMNFVYPSKNGAPLLTLRYKALKKGVEAFELLSLLERDAEAKKVISKVFSKVFRFQDIREFQPGSGKGISDLISLEYCHYTEAIDIITELLN